MAVIIVVFWPAAAGGKSEQNTGEYNAVVGDILSISEILQQCWENFYITAMIMWL